MPFALRARPHSQPRRKIPGFPVGFENFILYSELPLRVNNMNPEEIEKRLHELESVVSFIADTLPKLTLERNTAACVNGLAAQIEALESRIESLSERLAIWEQWATKQEKRIDDEIEEYLAGLETARRPCY